jgi:hypothetical protein
MLRASRLFRELRPDMALQQVPVIFTKTLLGPDGGFAGEERVVPAPKASHLLRDGCAVAPTPEARKGVWCFNPDTEQYDRFIERNNEFLDLQARKRQWLDVYWRVNQGYLLFGRASWGAGWLLNVPLRKQDVAQKLWEMYKVRVDWRLIEFREKERLTGITELGHTWCWLYMPGAEELGIDREVYDNKRVKVRIHVRKILAPHALY